MPSPRPACPKCGEPARVIILTSARVRCELHDDGTPGRVRSAARPLAGTVEYECSGGHVWRLS
jgi:hypothetical protein